MVARPVAALLGAPKSARCGSWPSSPSASRRCCRRIRALSVEPRARRSPRRWRRSSPIPATRFPSAGHHRRPCPARRGDDRRLLRQGRRRRPRHRAGRAARARCARLPQTQAHVDQVSRRRLFGRQSVRLRSRRRGQGGRAVAQRRAGPQERLADDRRARAGAVARRGAAAADARPDAWQRSARLGLDIRKVELANPLAAVDVDKPADHALVTAILEGRA